MLKTRLVYPFLIAALFQLSQSILSQQETPRDCNWNIVPKVSLAHKQDDIVIHILDVNISADDIKESHDKETDSVSFEFDYQGSTVKVTINARSFKITSEKIISAESTHDGDRLISSENYRLQGSRFERLPKKISVSRVSHELKDGNLVITLIPWPCQKAPLF